MLRGKRYLICIFVLLIIVCVIVIKNKKYPLYDGDQKVKSVEIYYLNSEKEINQRYVLTDRADECIQMLERIKVKMTIKKRGGYGDNLVVIYINYENIDGYTYICFRDDLITYDESGKELYRMSDEDYEMFIGYIQGLSE
ncbi:MAG: hypothetical protein E7263_04130 [Lachnospiraceae bacterium]|nr:hypothetical protein [Lachnospiraceae bacterium]